MPASLTELRVERHRGMMDVYRLVGLDRWESDASRIQQAIVTARRVLDQNPGTGDRHEHSQIAGYLTEAERILTDPTRKQKYDDSFRRALEAAGEPTTSVSEATATAKAADGARPPRQPPSPPTVRPVSQTNAAPAAGPQPVSSTPKFVAVAPPQSSRTSIWESFWESLRDTVSSFGSWAAGWWEALHDGAPVRFTLALISLCGIAAFLLSRFNWEATFPQSTVAPRAAGEFTTTATLSPKPTTPSIPGQRIGQPRIVPGLEDVEGYAPSLDATLTQIVFSVGSSGQNSGDFDLYLATRETPSASFQAPKRLDECSSEENETDPSLSPDGLELVFVRTTSSGSASLMRSVRESLSGSFSEAQAVQIPNLPSGSGVGYDSPQLLQDGGDLIVRVTETSSQGPLARYFVAHRLSLEDPFETAGPLPVFVDQARHFLTGDGLRAFVSRRYTIQLCCRPSVDTPFSAPGMLDALNATRIGMAEGPVWVSPAEDFLFYSMTFVNSSHQQRRHLWQVRFR